MPATILLTGATGLIGFRILLAALEAGHTVRYTARSEAKAAVVSSNPAVQRLAPGADRLSAVVIPDLAADGALDAAAAAAGGVTHIIHAGSPVPVPTYDPTTQVFAPTVAISRQVLRAALAAPSVRRVVITSSIVANLAPPGSEPPTAETKTPSAATRVPLPDPLPETFGDVFSAYVTGKMVEMRNSDEVAKTQSPHFSIAHVVPGYVFGRNELALDAGMMRAQNSSNNFLMMALAGGDVPFPIHGGYAHIDDVAELHLRVALDDGLPGGPRDVGIASKVDYATLFDAVERAFPKAVEAGVLKKGNMPTLPIEYDSSDAEAILGKFRSFESAVVDVAGQYLEKLGVEKA